MTDIDFDEIDRAVSGALGTKRRTTRPKPKVVDQTPITHSLNAKSDAPFIHLSGPDEHINEPIIDIVKQNTEESNQQTDFEENSELPLIALESTHYTQSEHGDDTAAPAVRRSSGRFMDMVHPSSVMRPRTAESQLYSHQEATISPQVNSLKPVVQPMNTSESYNENDIDPFTESPESPFLPDAKVEKRPLGGSETYIGKENESPELPSFNFEGLLDEPDEELLEAPKPQARIEAVTTPDKSTNSIDFMVIKKSNEFEAKEYAAPEPYIEKKPTVSPEALTGPISIIPQYVEQPSSRQESGNMYDTESYHQAVSQPDKKKSGWLNVLWIVLLIILGAAFGWVTYTYILPML